MRKRLQMSMGLVVLSAVVLSLSATSCIWLPPAPMGGYATIYDEGPAVSGGVAVYGVAPPVILPPTPVVVYNDWFHCDLVTGLDFPVFCVGGYFYACHHHHWYCCNRPGAGWVAVEERHVPRLLARQTAVIEQAGPSPARWKAYSTGRRHEISSFHERLPFATPPGATISPNATMPSHTVIPPHGGPVIQGEHHGTQVYKPQVFGPGQGEIRREREHEGRH